MVQQHLIIKMGILETIAETIGGFFEGLGKLGITLFLIIITVVVIYFFIMVGNALLS